MKSITRAALIGGGLTGSLLFGFLAGFEFYQPTRKSVAETVMQIQRSHLTNTQPQINLGERSRIPFSPLLALMSLASGGAALWLLAPWLLSDDKETASNSPSSVPPSIPAFVPFPTPSVSQNGSPAPVVSTQKAEEAETEQPINPLDLSFEERKNWLLKAIKAESPWMMQLLKATPMLVYGEQRCGKSQFTLFLMICRKLFCDHELEICSPHAHLEGWSEVANYILLYGVNFRRDGEYDFSPIQRRFEAYKERLTNPGNPYTVLWDEFTQYKGNLDTENIIKSFLSESQKTNQYPIIVSHGRTQEFLGGTKGTFDAMNQGFVMVHIIGDRDEFGEIRPSGKGSITGLTKDIKGQPETKTVNIPPHMRGDWLLQLFPELKTYPKPVVKKSAFEVCEVAISPEAQALNRLLEIEAVEPPIEIKKKASSGYDLTLEQSTLYSYCLRKGKPLQIRDILSAKVKGLEGLNAEDLRAIVEELNSINIGSWDGKEYTA